MVIVICSLLEYITSYVMEKIFKARWWDYSDNKFNINGRICLETLIPFGILGCIIMYVINPIISNLLLIIPPKVLVVLSVFIVILFILDNIISYTIITKLHISTKDIIMDNTEEITKKVREYIYNNSRFGKRLMNSFSSLKILKEKYKK